MLVVAAYTTAALATFQFDDFNIVVGNGAVHSLSAWLASMPGIRPLTKLSYALNWSIDPAPAGFVAFNLACHLASALLVLALVRRWLPALAPSLQRPGAAAFVAASVFALHPAQTEAVTYVAGRSVSLAACLYLVSLWTWERWRESADGGAWRATSCIAFALALAARETAWTLPFAILLVEAARSERIASTLSRLRWHALVLAVAALAIVASPTYGRLLSTSFALRGPVDNLAAQAHAIAYLVTRPMIALHLDIDPDVRAPALDAAWLVEAACIVAAIGVAFAQWRRRRWLAFAVLWFFLHLFPTNGPVARLDLANDRQLYLALAGPALVLGVALAASQRRAPATAAAATIALVLGLATLVRNLDYRSEVALWEASARTSPGKPRVFNNLGVAWREAGDPGRARTAFERAIALDPDDYKAKQNLHELR